MGKRETTVVLTCLFGCFVLLFFSFQASAKTDCVNGALAVDGGMITLCMNIDKIQNRFHLNAQGKYAEAVPPKAPECIDVYAGASFTGPISRRDVKVSGGSIRFVEVFYKAKTYWGMASGFACK